MTELKKDATNRNLGKQPHVCRVCGAKGEFETYLAREMMQGKREEFPYFVCGRCRCLQIVSVPENLGDYYGNDYYSFQMPENDGMEFKTPVTHTEKVLDVGCGSGYWLVQKAAEGWGNLYGCDPFLDKDRHYGERVRIRSCSIHEMEGEGTFDLIHMGDSFEHMTDPLDVLKSARRLLKQDGLLYMRIPTYPNIAFERYGPCWYQLDAPRHIFLHSRESLEWLGKASGMTVSGTRYDSNSFQFVRSYFYQHDVPYWEQGKLVPQYFSRADLAELEKDAACANKKGYGDHMEVFWQKNLLSEGENVRKVIFQKFSRKEGRHPFPYPPVYREKDTDYICFTDDGTVHSSVWTVQKVEDLEQLDADSLLGQYGLRWELYQTQIQMGPVWDGHSRENVVSVPVMAGKQKESAGQDGNPMQDIREYPKDMRELFRLAEEYRAAGDRDTAVKLFAEVIAVSGETGDERGRSNGVVRILSVLYDGSDPRLFMWASYLERVCSLTAAQKAEDAWFGEELAKAVGKPAAEVLVYYEVYEKLLGQYRADPDESRAMTFYRLEAVEDEKYIMKARMDAFFACMELREEERALDLFNGITPETVEDNRAALLTAGFQAGDAVYDAVCARLTPVQWEEWSTLILDTFAAGMAEEKTADRQEKRFSGILSRISVSAIISWIESSGEKRRGKAGECLMEYAFSCPVRNRDIREAAMQELCLCAWLLKEAYVLEWRKEHEDNKDGGQKFCVVMKDTRVKEWKGSDSREIWYRYLTVLGAFAEKYYNPEYLIDAKSCVIAPDILAAYRMAVVLADGTASSENVAILKQALEIFPPFHEEVRSVLMRLK